MASADKPWEFNPEIPLLNPISEITKTRSYLLFKDI
jgi:hypothetical protein